MESRPALVATTSSRLNGSSAPSAISRSRHSTTRGRHQFFSNGVIGWRKRRYDKPTTRTAPYRAFFLGRSSAGSSLRTHASMAASFIRVPALTKFGAMRTLNGFCGLRRRISVWQWCSQPIQDNAKAICCACRGARMTAQRSKLSSEKPVRMFRFQFQMH
jgi:hypothetical protein